MENEVEKVEILSAELASADRAVIDSQIATAKAYPRNLKRCRDNSIAIATMNLKTAESCRYSLPRGGKKITGASVHLARIVAQQYGNMRVESRVKQITATTIVAEAIAFDLEVNYAVKAEVTKKILDKDGRKYNEDMIVTTGQAACAIAWRNAVLQIIPNSIVDDIYNAALNMVVGDLSNEEKMIKARKVWIDYFVSTYSATEQKVLEVFGLRSVNQITAEVLADMKALDQGIKDKMYDAFEVFGDKEKQKSTFNPAKAEAKKDEKPTENKLGL